MAKRRLIYLDGRTLEGGGQLLRVALCLSALTGSPVEIDNIRGNRSSGGGLKAQHLACVNWLATATKAKVTGGEKGSKKLLFEPDVHNTGIQPVYSKRATSTVPGKLEATVDIGTAGSTGLVLQAILPYILFAPPQIPASTTSTNSAATVVVVLHLSGGTNVSGSPSFEYISQVLLPTLHSLGLPYISSQLLNRGWSQGRASTGSFVLEIPSIMSMPLPAFTMKSPEPNATLKKPHLAITFLGPHHAHKHFMLVILPAVQHHFGREYQPEEECLSIVAEDSGDDKRLYLIIVATVTSGEREYKLGSDWLYDRKIRLVERAVTEMCEKVSANIYDEWHSGACVDEHMRDQLVVFEALAKGTSSLWAGRQADGTDREPSLHARTAQWVAGEMLDVQFGANDICDGVGFDAAAERVADAIADVSIS